MENMTGDGLAGRPLPRIPWFGARKLARTLVTRLRNVETQLDSARQRLESVGVLSVLQLEARREELERETSEQASRLEEEKAAAAVALEAFRTDSQVRCAQLGREAAELVSQIEAEQSRATQELESARTQLELLQRSIVETEDLVLLQEIGIYRYRHPLTDVVAYQAALAEIDTQIRAMARMDGGAVLAATNWTVNGSESEGRTMVRQYSKLMLRAFNAEADTLVRWLKPYKLDGALDRLKKVAEAIERLGRTMKIRIAPAYYELRIKELEITADFLQKQAEQREAERVERERMREERKAQRELEAERARLAKERQHHANALQVLVAKNDAAAAARLREQIVEIDRAIENVDYRAANIRAGYVYLISNVGSFGPDVVKLGLTRRLDPLDRIRELSDASVPFNFDVHALFFSKDAVGIETAMHARLEKCRVNTVNRRREFFRTTPSEVKAHLSELAGELLEFEEIPEALEYRQSMLTPSIQAPELRAEALASA